MSKMKKIKHISVLLLLLPLLLGSCKKENRCDCIKRTGDIIMDVRHPGAFDKIFLENNLNVFITQDSVTEVTVEAGENIAPLIKTEVVDGTLFIRNKNRCNWTRSYKKPLNVYIRMPKISFITSDGTGDIKSLNTITTDTLDVQTKNSGGIELTVNNLRVLSHMHGSGDVVLRGNTSEHDISIGGTAYIYAQELQTTYTYIHTFTLGISYIRASSLLICRLDEKGDVFCFGAPATVQKEQNGTGKLYLR
ncbi:MAG: hypothetical protein JWO09_1374 [Bacteroidetes bacterium]|nr:hypothetical protein [Bacteroidota bacterium]